MMKQKLLKTRKVRLLLISSWMFLLDSLALLVLVMKKSMGKKKRMRKSL